MERTIQGTIIILFTKIHTDHFYKNLNYFFRLLFEGHNNHKRIQTRKQVWKTDLK